MDIQYLQRAEVDGRFRVRPELQRDAHEHPKNKLNDHIFLRNLEYEVQNIVQSG
jgi:hypothetical protein